MTTSDDAPIDSFGEKTIIRDLVKPLFNAMDDPGGVGDDCAIIDLGSQALLLSTDRVPSDLIAFKAGLLDYRGLGDYLARLNLSDIAACGGHALGLLLNLGLPANLKYSQVEELCEGFKSRAYAFGVDVVGGDTTSSAELSISATSVGIAEKGKVLTRRDARPGDSIFISRPLGLTPAAFQVLFGSLFSKLEVDEVDVVKGQFTDMQPMLKLGLALANHSKHGACMDNTDGIGQSLLELSDASGCAFVVRESALNFPALLVRVCELTNQTPIDLAFNGGADFSLVGTLRGDWTSNQATSVFGQEISIIGHVETGAGTWLLGDNKRSELNFQGWDYFS